MKKLFAVILSIIYFTASSGVVFHVHYCMGELSSVRLQNGQANVCKCGMKSNNKSCCHSEVKVLKLSNVHKQAIANILVQSPEVVLSRSLSLIDISCTYPADIQQPSDNDPPIYSPNKIYLANCVFRI